jgi:hypothetical protein
MSSPERARILERLSKNLRELFEHDQKADAAAGSPNPAATAMGHMLRYVLTFARVGLAHRQPDHREDNFDALVDTAREMSADDWAAHRAGCQNCEGH